MKIEVLGPGCANCERLAANARAALEKLGVEAEILKVTAINEITARGVMMTPALAVDGEVKISGRVAGEEELSTILQAASG